MHEMGNQRREAVVVPEPDLMRGDRVVLVYHRDDAEVEQSVQGASGVGVVRTARDVVSRQQDLTDGEVIHPEREAVRRDEGPLTDAGCGLLGGQIARATEQTQRGDARRNGTGGDEDDLSAPASACGDHVDQRAEPGVIECAVRGGQRAGADLDDKSPGGPQVSVTGRGHRRKSSETSS